MLGEFGGLGLGVDGHTWSGKTWGYRGAASKEDLTRKYERLLAGVWKLKEEKGLNAAVYTQITDVETEANGLLTYDREIIKLDLDRAAAVNKVDVSKMPQLHTLVASSQDKPQTWRYTFEKPAKDWYQPDFKDADWKEGPGGFGTKGTPGAIVRTEWKTNDIWIRREFEIADENLGEVLLTMHHDDDVEVYINGVLAFKEEGYVSNYEEFAFDERGPCGSQERQERVRGLLPSTDRRTIHRRGIAGIEEAIGPSKFSREPRERWCDRARGLANPDTARKLRFDLEGIRFLKTGGMG